MFGLFMAYSFYNLSGRYIESVHSWPIRYFGIDLTDGSGHANEWFWVFVTAWGAAGALIYVVPAAFSKFILDVTDR